MITACHLFPQYTLVQPCSGRNASFLFTCVLVNCLGNRTPKLIVGPIADFLTSRPFHEYRGLIGWQLCNLFTCMSQETTIISVDVITAYNLHAVNTLRACRAWLRATFIAINDIYTPRANDVV